MHRLHVILSDDLGAALEAAAEIEGLTFSQATRRAIGHYVDAVAAENKERHREGDHGAVEVPTDRSLERVPE